MSILIRRKGGRCRLWCAALATVALFVAPLAAAEAPADFATHVPLVLSGNGPWYRLTLPLEFQMDARHTDMRDLRVFDAVGVAMPYAVVRASSREARAEERTAVRMFPLRGTGQNGETTPAIRLRIGADGTLLEVGAGDDAKEVRGIRRGWLLDLGGATNGAGKLSLDWHPDADTGEGFQRFSIEGSKDLRSWSRLGSGQIARLSFNGEQIDQREVELPTCQYRYLRLLWETPREAPLLTAVQLAVLRTTVQGAPFAWSEPIVARRNKGGDYLLTLPVALPLERLRVELPQPNTLAPLEVAGRYTTGAPRDPWMVQARSILYRLPLDGVEKAHDEMALPGRALKQLRLRVDARGGGLGADTITLRIGLTASEVFFLARGSAPYLVATGNEKSVAADIPLSTLIPGYNRQSDSVGTARMGAVLRAADTPSTEAVKSPSNDWKRMVLWAVLLGGVGLLAAMTLHLVRKPQR